MFLVGVLSDGPDVEKFVRADRDDEGAKDPDQSDRETFPHYVSAQHDDDKAQQKPKADDDGRPESQLPADHAATLREDLIRSKH